MLGKNLGHYRIREQIGAGGMGVVFLAHDEQLERDVAIKSCPPALSPTTLPASDSARKPFPSPNSIIPTSQPSTISILTAKPVIHETERMQALSDLFEARFARADLELKYGNRVTGGTLVAGVQKDAGASGFVLIARKAAEAAGRSRQVNPKPGNGTRQVLP
jgi:hypothetical protein